MVWFWETLVSKLKIFVGRCKSYAGVISPSGILYVILLLLVLLDVVVYFSWSYSVKVVGNQRVRSIVLAADIPYFYNVSSDSFVYVYVPVINPSPRVMILKELVVAGVEIPLNDTSLGPGERRSIILGWDVLREL